VKIIGALYLSLVVCLGQRLQYFHVILSSRKSSIFQLLLTGAATIVDGPIIIKADFSITKHIKPVAYFNL
jgi:hypothetical protein